MSRPAVPPFLRLPHWPRPAVCSGACSGSAAVARDQVQVRHRHVELCLIAYSDAGTRSGRHPDRARRGPGSGPMPCSSCTTGHRRGPRRGPEHAVDVGRLRTPAPGLPRAARIQLGLGDERKPFRHQHGAHGERCCSDTERIAGRVESRKSYPPSVAVMLCVNISASVCNRQALSAQSSTRPPVAWRWPEIPPVVRAGALAAIHSSGGTPRAISLSPALQLVARIAL